MTAVAEFTRVYMASARIAHLVLAGTAISGAPRALCGMRTYQEKPWFGTGDQAEYQKAAALPLCGKCETAANGASPLPGEGGAP